jgi:hypothetical protein
MDSEQLIKLVSPVITLLLGAIIKYYTEEKSKIISYFGHISAFTLQNDQKSEVYSHSIIVSNAGRKSAKNVRVCHQVLPPNILTPNININPSIQYSIERNPEGAIEIVIPILVPKEQVTISYLYFPPLTVGQINSYTKSDDGLAKIINVIPTPQPSKILRVIVWLLMFVGGSFTLYWIIKLIAAIV